MSASSAKIYWPLRMPDVVNVEDCQTLEFIKGVPRSRSLLEIAKIVQSRPKLKGSILVQRDARDGHC